MPAAAFRLTARHYPLDTSSCSPTPNASTCAGLGPNLVAEMERALTDHELVKVRARVGDRGLRDELLAQLAAATRSEMVQRIGHVALYYRRHPDTPQVLLPDA